MASRWARPPSTAATASSSICGSTTGADAAQDEAVAALEKAGHPVVRIDDGRHLPLGQEFFRWEIATAVAGAIIGINPFDQPDVEASKVKTRELTAAYEKTGACRRDADLARRTASPSTPIRAMQKRCRGSADGDARRLYRSAHLRRARRRRLRGTARLYRPQSSVHRDALHAAAHA